MSYLKALFLTGPVFTIKLKEGCLPDIDQLTQYLITCLDDHERFSILVAMFKLKLIVGKTIIFVNDINRCYLTSLLLRAFGLKACVLNSSMPANSRFYVIDQYNRNTFEIVIASDAVDTLGNDTGHTKELSHRDKEAGVSRGIDFNHVSNVVNLDFPTSTDIYIHRVGRTARGGSRGTALSICTPTERVYLEAISKDINEQLGKNVMIPYEIRVGELDSFLLRVKEVLSKCGKSVIKAARMHEIRLEMMRSAKLESFFANNPREKSLMETCTRPTVVTVYKSAVANVPEYMVPMSLRGATYSVGIKRKKKSGQRRRNKLQSRSSNQKAFKRKKNDPLRTFTI